MGGPVTYISPPCVYLQGSVFKPFYLACLHTRPGPCTVPVAFPGLWGPTQPSRPAMSQGPCFQRISPSIWPLKSGCGFYLFSFLQGSKQLSQRGAGPNPSSKASLSRPCAFTGPHSGGAGGLRRCASVPGHSSPLIIKQASPDVGGSHRICHGNGPIFGRPEPHLSL